MTVAAGTVAVISNLWRAFVDGLIDNDEKGVSSKSIHNLRLECKIHTLFMTKMAKIKTLCMTKTAVNHTLLGPHIPI